MIRLPVPHLIRLSPPKNAVLMAGAALRQAYHLGDAALANCSQPRHAWCGALASVVDDGDLALWGQNIAGDERYCPQCAAMAHKHHVVLGGAPSNRSLWQNLLLAPDRWRQQTS